MRVQKAFRLWVILFFVVAVLTACEKKPLLPPPAPGAPIEERADFAWNTKDYRQSETLYREVLAQKGLSVDKAQLAHERVTLSALYSGRPGQALVDLDTWAKKFPKIRTTWPWHQAKIEAHFSSNQPALAKEHLARTLLDTTLPKELRFQAGKALAETHWQSRELNESLRVMSELYGQCPDKTCRLDLERDLGAKLQGMKISSLESLLQGGTEASKYSFPELHIRWRLTLAKIEDDPVNWAQVWQTLQQLLQNGLWADKAEPSSILNQLEARYGRVKTQGLALLLPLSGTYNELGWKVLHGAETAQKELASLGLGLEVRVINADAPDWESVVDNLPAEFTVVGGPLQAESLNVAMNRGLHRKKAFFAFVPTLQEGSEGKDAWRFFGSAKDQVRSLLFFAKEHLNISAFGVIYPDERYGLTMSKAFWQEATALGGEVRTLKSYPPKESKHWPSVIQEVLFKTSKNIDKDREPTPDFGALFIPDSLSKVQLLVPQLHYYNEDRLVLLGPELWSQSWNSMPQTETQYFQLALMPSAWWPESNTPAVQSLRAGLAREGLGQPDFWSALGYDFVRFAGTLGQISPGWSASSLNQKLAQAESFDWSLAPIRWDAKGNAVQHMFLVSPSRDGKLSLADPQETFRILTAIKKRHNERLAKKSSKSAKPNKP